MAWSNPSASGVPAALARPDSPPLRILRRVAAYFDAEMTEGRMQRHDPELLARTFLGGIQHFVLFELLAKAQGERPLPVEPFMRGFAKLLWTGVAPRSRKAPRDAD
jgi:hypothetical protein